MTDGDLSFYYHVSGDIELDVSLSTTHILVPTWKSTIFTPTDAGLSFYYHISGDIVETIPLQTTSRLVFSKNTKKIVSIPLYTKSILTLWKQVRYLCVLNLHTVSTLEPEEILNAGYVDVIQIGDLILKNAVPNGKRTYSFPCSEKRLLDGSLSLHVRKGLSYVGKFKFETKDYSDIQTLFNMVGELQTLRVYGVPYRNCMIWSPIELQEYKPKYSRWGVEIVIYQDTSRTSITS